MTSPKAPAKRFLSHIGFALNEFTKTQQLIAFGVLVGAVSGLAAYFFDRSIFLASMVVSYAARPGGLIRIGVLLIFPPLGAFLGFRLIRRFSPGWSDHGVNVVYNAIERDKGRIEGKVAWVKSIASGLTIGFGGSAGREGPVIQIGAAAGSWLGQMLKVSSTDLSMLAAAGASAGLSAAFGTPLTAVFFTMEVVLKNFANDAFAAVVISSVTASAVARFLMGSDRFLVPLNYDFHGFAEFLQFAALGLLCGPLGTLYMRALHWVERVSERHLGKSSTAPIIGGLVVGGIALIWPEIMGMGQTWVNAALLGKITGTQAGALALAKTAATAATLGTGGSGGALMPSLYIGAMGGAAWAELFHYLTGGAIQYGAFALVGMACVLTSAFQAPLTGMLFALEVSQDYDILMPVMTACIIAYLTTRRREESPTIEN